MVVRVWSDAPGDYYLLNGVITEGMTIYSGNRRDIDPDKMYIHEAHIVQGPG